MLSGSVPAGPLGCSQSWSSIETFGLSVWYEGLSASIISGRAALRAQLRTTMSLEIRNVRLAHDSKSPLFDVFCEDGQVESIIASSPANKTARLENVVDGEGGLLLPS